jgi:hypothetical protein
MVFKTKNYEYIEDNRIFRVKVKFEDTKKNV